jgi:hypothetical protein
MVSKILLRQKRKLDHGKLTSFFYLTSISYSLQCPLSFSKMSSILEIEMKDISTRLPAIAKAYEEKIKILIEEKNELQKKLVLTEGDCRAEKARTQRKLEEATVKFDNEIQEFQLTIASLEFELMHYKRKDKSKIFLASLTRPCKYEIHHTPTKLLGFCLILQQSVEPRQQK